MEVGDDGPAFLPLFLLLEVDYAEGDVVKSLRKPHL